MRRENASEIPKTIEERIWEDEKWQGKATKLRKGAKQDIRKLQEVIRQQVTKEQE